jgi:RNA polymerase sigma factor (sigma-70 family)
VPKQFDDLRRRIALAAQYLARRFGRRVREEELAEYLEMPVHKVVEALVPNERAVSLEGAAQDEEATLAETLADPRSIDPTEEIAAKRQSEALDEMLAGLKGRDQQVLAMRYGGDATEDVTLEDVGRELGVTRERARQLEARALRGLRLGQTARPAKKHRPRN